MPFRGHALEGLGPFLWVGIGIGGRWLYGRLFDSPAASEMELVLSGAIIGTACYALIVFAPMALGVFAKRKESRDD